MTNFTKQLQQAISGIKSLGLPTQVVGGVIEKNSKEFINIAQSNIQDDTGNLSRSIGFIDKNPRFRFAAVRLIGARVYGGYKGYHAYIYEHGTQQRNYEGANRGQMPAHNQMSRAFNSYKDTFLANTEKDLIRIVAEKAQRAGFTVK
jgi:hypothetical protein